MKFLDNLKRTILQKRTLFLLLGPFGFLCLKLAAKSSYFAEEIFAKRLFKAVAVVVSNITGILPFSLAEASIFLGIPLLLVVIVGGIVKIVRKPEVRAKVVGNYILNLLCAASAVYFFYAFGCGTNYYREPVATTFGLETRDSAKEELRDLLVELAKEAVELRAQIDTQDEYGAMALNMSDRALAKECQTAFKNLSNEYEIFRGPYPAPKTVLASHLMSYTNLTGIYTCWTMEANVNVDIADYSIASTMCHELAHLRGFIREDEANFIAYMACMASDNVYVKYSGTMHALIHVGNALYGKDAEMYFDVYRNYYSDELITDLVKNNEYWQQFEKTVVAEKATELNDNYLKANHQEDGVASYGRVVDLLLALYRQQHGIQ